jgi:MazG family protein
VQGIDDGDDGAIVEEAGDLLLVLALIARIGEDEGRFDLSVVARNVCDKLVRRHPHVFGDVEVSGAAHALANWEMIKQNERKSKPGDASSLAGVPRALPALQRAQRLAQKAISAGFRWTDEGGAFGKLAEELGELERELGADERDAARLESELGDVLFAGAILGQYLGLDAEKALRGASTRFEHRFRAMEASAGGPLRGRSLEELLSLWKAAKAVARP